MRERLLVMASKLRTTRHHYRCDLALLRRSSAHLAAGFQYIVLGVQGGEDSYSQPFNQRLQRHGWQGRTGLCGLQWQPGHMDETAAHP